jgi:hypothetical protein
MQTRREFCDLAPRMTAPPGHDHLLIPLGVVRDSPAPPPSHLTLAPAWFCWGRSIHTAKPRLVATKLLAFQQRQLRGAARGARLRHDTSPRRPQLRLAAILVTPIDCCVSHHPHLRTAIVPGEVAPAEAKSLTRCGIGVARHSAGRSGAAGTRWSWLFEVVAIKAKSPRRPCCHSRSSSRHIVIVVSSATPRPHPDHAHLLLLLVVVGRAPASP